MEWIFPLTMVAILLLVARSMFCFDQRRMQKTTAELNRRHYEQNRPRY